MSDQDPSHRTRTFPHGVPCWVDVDQPDLEAGERFYAGLFGWEFHDAMPPEAPESYLVATLDGVDVGAMWRGEGRGPAWNTYIACDDADATAERIRAAGGSATEPGDAGPAGRLAGCTDPQGVPFVLWQAGRRPGVQVANVPGAWNFSHLHTDQSDAAVEFYSAVFGWQRDAELGAGMLRVPGYGDHLAATVDPDIHRRQEFAPPGFADVVAGLVESTDRSGWQVSFTVADRDESVSTAESLGATVISSADTEWTREALIRDPQGAELTLSQFTPPD